MFTFTKAATSIFIRKVQSLHVAALAQQQLRHRFDAVVQNCVQPISATEMTEAQKVQFYRRKLPDTCISFYSEEGKQIFAEALKSGYMSCYFKLAAQFRTQDEPAFCGLSTLVMVLNALDIDPGQVWKGPWRWYHENMLDCCVPLQIVERKGIVFEQFTCIADCNSLSVSSVRADDSACEAAFRDTISEYCKRDDAFVVSSYSRKVVKQSGDGHFSTLGGYHSGRDLVLIMDTARFKYPPHWIPVTLLWKAMQALDKDTGKPRGYVILSRKPDMLPLLLFRISSCISLTLPNGIAPDVVSFVERWHAYLQKTQQSETWNFKKEIIITLLDCVLEFEDDHTILTTQIDNCCPKTLSEEHVCFLYKLLAELEQTELFSVVKEVARELDREIHGCGTTSNPTVGQTLCKVRGMVSAPHFVTMVVLSWPYTNKEHCTIGAFLSGYTKMQLSALKLLSGETETLRRQLSVVFKMQFEKHCIKGDLDRCRKCSSCVKQ